MTVNTRDIYINKVELDNLNVTLNSIGAEPYSHQSQALKTGPFLIKPSRDIQPQRS